MGPQRRSIMNKILVIHPKDKSTDFLKPIYHGRSDVTVITGGCTKEDVAKAIDEHDHIVMMGHGTPQGLLAMGNFNGKTKTYKPSHQVRASGKPVTPSQIKSLYSSTGKAPGLPNREPGIDDEWDADLKELNELKEDDWLTSRKVGSYTGYSQYGGYSGSYQSLSTGYVIDDSNADQLRGKKLTAIWCNADQFIEWNDLGGFYTGMFVSEEAEAKMIGCADTEKWQVEQQNYAFVEVIGRFLDQDAETMCKALDSHYGPLAERNSIAKYNLKRFYSRKAGQESGTKLAVL